ncbi:filamentous hemagglutinin N-terminal domain-containing protein [Burkholderia cepacia]|uniref:two-partner secretion domain-containing protein n=1 Tax=Burkholderia cepacia TaxID=292 RepID=UPI0013F47F0C|nr:filamentous hemagglutinin N-terminal domain-containing protein [Burkholderia cepacia]NHB05607.1 filamentous hemagglutinin N-terminal domain-containing protein [Burkholderia cepacia]
MRRKMRDVVFRHVQRGTAKQKIIFGQASLKSEEHALWVKATAWVMSVVMYLSPAVLLIDQTAHAAPIIDPRAPIPFQPTVTATSSGVPAINIPAPNSNGVSLGQYQSFNVGPEGLVLNNSTIPGTPLLGGSLGANPNLNGRPASLIINQVTSNNIAVLNGPLETFGAAAPVVIAAPGGISTNGLSLTNIPNLTLTTGTPQFITGVGGTPTDFAHAGAVAYDVRSGNISINGPAGVNGPGAGIEGTVGNIDLIGQTVTLAAPIRADQRINVVTGNQLVTPTTTGNTGTAYGTAANGLPNNVTAIQTPNGLAIDANQFGSVTAGQVYIVQTAAGLGANMQGPLTATAGNVVVNSNGDVTVGQTFASQSVSLTSAGNTTISGTGLANQNYTVNANGDINATGSVSAGQNVSMNAGGNLNAASVAANGSANLIAGQSMSIGSLSAHDVALQATNGDLTVGGLSAPGAISAKAGRDLTVNGAVQGGSTVALTGGRNASVNGAVSGVDKTSIAATTGTAQIAGSAISNAALSVTAGQDALVGGNVSAQGPLTVTASAGDATISGTAVTPGTLTVQSGGTTTLGGQTQAATANVSGGNVAVNGALTTTNDATLAATNGNLTGTGAIGTTTGNVALSASQSIAYGGAVQSGGAVTATAGQDATLSNVSAPGAIAITAGRDAKETGSLTGGSTVSMMAGRGASVSGTVASVGDTTITAQVGSATVSGSARSNGALTVSAGQNVTIGGTAQAQGPVSITARAGSLTGQGNVTSSQGAVNLAAGQAIALNGAVQSGSTISAVAGTDASFGGTVAAPGAVTILAGQDTTLAGSVTSGGNLSVTSGGSTSLKAAAASVGDMTLAANGGSLSTSGNVVSTGALNASGQQGVNLGGTVYSGGNAQIGSTAGSVAVAGTVSTPGTLNINAGQDASVAGTVQSGQNTTIAAARDANLNGGLEVGNSGNANVTAGRDINGTGAIGVANDTTLKAGNNIGISGTVQTGNNLTATAGNNLSVGATTAVGTSTLTATNGAAALTGDALSGGTTTITAGTDVNTQGSVKSLGDLSVNAKSGNLTAARTVSTAGNAALNAGQNLTLAGQTTVSKSATLAATNITTQGVSAGGNLTATASHALDTSAGQLNAQFDANAPALSVGGNATLSGANVTTANALVGGATQITGTQSLTMGGTAAFKGDATLAGGTVNNVGTQMAAGNLNVSGTTVTNSGALSSLQTATINAADLVNSGSVYGPTTNVTASGSVTNSGSLLATSALNVTTANLSNQKGVLYAGDVANPTAATGNTTVTVTGGNGSFNNSGGTIYGQNNATLNLPNQTLDPSASTFGTVDSRNGVNLSAQSVNNSGAWTLPSSNVAVSTAQGFNNTGTINQGIGALTLNGAVGNTGTINGNDLTINGSLANQTGGTVAALDALTLNGSGTNSGTVHADNTLTIAGTSYDNSNGVTSAGNSKGLAGSGNATINLSGDLGNAGGTLTATNDLKITANNVNNSAAATVTTTTTTKTVDNPGLLMATPIGSELVYAIFNVGKDGGTLTLGQANLPATLGGLLSVGGEQPTNSTVWSISSARPIYQGWGDPSSPVASSGTIQFALVPTSNAPKGAMWVVVPPSTPVSGATTVQTLALPTVTETTTTTGASVTSSVIAAGHDLSLTANALNNQSGIVSAGHDASMNVQQLQNGGSSFTSSVTDTVDGASLNAFLTSLQALEKSGPIGVAGTANPSGTYQCEGGYCLVGTPTPPATYTISAPGTVPLETTTRTATTQGAVGQILAGNNLDLSGGNLTNTGTLAAGNDVTIQAASFTNQGSNVGSKAVTAGCASGVSNAGCSNLRTTNPNSEAYSYQQTNSNVTAGHDIVIAANQVSNTYGNLVAKNDVVIGGAGTTAANTTQAASVTNTSAAIEAGHNVQINAASVTNTIAAPVAVHQNYGSASPYSGCGQNCEAYVEVQSATPSTITANNDLSIAAGMFSNTGSLVTALNTATINATQSASSDNQYLHAYWTGNPVGTRTWGCLGMASVCQNLYGGAFNAGDAQAVSGLPSNVGLPDFVPGTIQAGNLSVHSPTLNNTGNVIGQTVTLTGSTLTNPNVFTPPPVVSGQVISLAPPTLPGSIADSVNKAGLVTDQNGRPTSVTGMTGLPANTPIGSQPVGQPVAPVVTVTTRPVGASPGSASAPIAGTPQSVTVKTIAGATTTVSYLTSNPAAQVVDSLSSAALIANLPANLQPGSVPFYYDPYTENQLIQQAALQAIGKSSFYSTTSATDSTSQASINNQDKAALYGAALEYAEKNNVALGTKLSEAQLAQINAPMLWYVEQSVPEPGCSTTGGAACSTVQALMPEVLLPKNFAEVNADGEITGTNVTLNFANSILNTGTVTAQNLTVNTGSLTNQQRSTDIGTIYQKGPEGVTLQTTGTVAQQGGFMSAANYDLQVQSLNQIGGALKKVGADGAVDTAGTQAMLANLKSQLGGNFTQQTVTDHLDTQALDSDSWFDQIFMTGVIVGLSIMGGMAASGAIGAAAGASAGSGSAFAAAGTTVGSLGAGTANAALSAGFAGMMNSTMSQLNSGGSFSLGSMLTTAGAAALTAGLTNGITFSDGAAGWSWAASNNSLAALAGVQTVGNTLVPQAGAATGSLPATITAIAAESVLQATVQTALQGGSFLTNLRNSAATNAAASIAYTIGNLNQDGTLTGAAYVAAHAALGCAAGAATGQGCGGGAIGGAVSAALTPDVLRVIDPSGAALDQGQVAMLAAISTWVGGGIAGLAGQNAMAGATAAQNEALNNDAESSTHTATAVKNGGALSAAADMLLTAMMPWRSQTGQTYMQPVTSTAKGVGDIVQANYGNKSQLPTDANRQIDPSGGPDNTPTAPATVTPVLAALCAVTGGLGCVTSLLLGVTASTPTSPSNVSLSSGNGDSGSSATQGNGGTASNSRQGLDWSVVSKSGETRPDHVTAQHGDLNLQKQAQGVFYGDPVSTVNDAWSIAQKTGVQPVASGGADVYVVPRPNSGYAGGYSGQRQNLNSVTIITVHGTNQVITAYPGNGLPLPKAP